MFLMDRCNRFWVVLWLVGATGAIVSCILGLVQTNRYYNSASSSVEWILVGGVTESSAAFRVHYLPRSSSSSSTAATAHQLVVSTSPELSSNRVYESDPLNATSVAYNMHAFTVDNALQPDTMYYYGLVSSDSAILLPGHFHTPAVTGTRWNFTIALAGCAKTGSQSSVFDVIRQNHQPDLFLHLGDFHYEDIACTCLEQRLDAVHTVLGSRPQAELYRSTILARMWDDHDWMGNDSGMEEAELGARDAALQSYDIQFPHYDLAAFDSSNPNAAISPYHAFTLGTVRFIVTDLRSESTDTSIYSDAQREWFYRELSQAANYDFVIWATTIPYIGKEDPSKDSWLGYAEDRRQLSEFMAQTIGNDGPQNLLAVSADAHMLAFDDGTNTYYGGDETNQSAWSFPILHSGPLDRSGSAKGGPYTEGCYSVQLQHNHQFSVIEFEMPMDNATDACMNIHAYKVHERRASEELVFSKRLCGEIFVPSESGVREGTCEIDTIEQIQSVILGLAMASLVCGILAVLYWYGTSRRPTVAIVALLLGAWWVTLLIGMGVPYSGGVQIWLLVPIGSVVLGQTVVMGSWIAYSGHLAASKPLSSSSLVSGNE